MKLKFVVHDSEEGGYWAEVPSIPGCATQGETFEKIINLKLSLITVYCEQPRPECQAPMASCDGKLKIW